SMRSPLPAAAEREGSAGEEMSLELPLPQPSRIVKLDNIPSAGGGVTSGRTTRRVIPPPGGGGGGLSGGDVPAGEGARPGPFAFTPPFTSDLHPVHQRAGTADPDRCARSSSVAFFGDWRRDCDARLGRGSDLPARPRRRDPHHRCGEGEAARGDRRRNRGA